MASEWGKESQRGEMKCNGRAVLGPAEAVTRSVSSRHGGEAGRSVWKAASNPGWDYRRG